MAIAKHQKFIYREIARGMIHEAPYNPNQMVASSFAALKDNIKASGLVDTLIWNEKTGNLVGGHHRLHALDLLEGNKNYTLGVAVVSLSEKREMEMNIFLNNAQAQGHFDKSRFFAMLADEPLISLDAIGFSINDLKMEFGDDLPPVPQLAVLPDFVADLKRKATAPSKASVNRKQPEAAADDASSLAAATKECLLLVTFPNNGDKVAFLTKKNLPLSSEFIGIRELGLV
jgi:ParB-like nuclease family protein